MPVYAVRVLTLGEAHASNMSARVHSESRKACRAASQSASGRRVRRHAFFEICVPSNAFRNRQYIRGERTEAMRGGDLGFVEGGAFGLFPPPECGVG